MEIEDWLNTYRKLDRTDLFESHPSFSFTDIRLKIIRIAVYLLKISCLTRFSGNEMKIRDKAGMKSVKRLTEKIVKFLIETNE